MNLTDFLFEQKWVISIADYSVLSIFESNPELFLKSNRRWVLMNDELPQFSFFFELHRENFLHSYLVLPLNFSSEKSELIFFRFELIKTILITNGSCDLLHTATYRSFRTLTSLAVHNWLCKKKSESKFKLTLLSARLSKKRKRIAVVVDMVHQVYLKFIL